jgi:hypothetical protein
VSPLIVLVVAIMPLSSSGVVPVLAGVLSWYLVGASHNIDYEYGLTAQNLPV